MILEIQEKSYLNELVELEKNCFQNNFWNEQQILSHLKTGKTLVFQEEKILGYVFYLESYWEIEILRIGVKEEFQRNKIGTKLLNYLKSKKKEIFLEVSNLNIKAINFYKKNEFKSTYIRKKYYLDGSDAICFSWKLS